MALHLTKIAFGIDTLDELAERIAMRAASGGMFLNTRYLPKRHEEVADGGSLYWIIKHQLVARSAITGFGEIEGGRTAIHLAPELVLVQARPKRAHQGWRYLEAKDAPPDLSDAGGEISAMPSSMVSELSALSLI